MTISAVQAVEQVEAAPADAAVEAAELADAQGPPGEGPGDWSDYWRCMRRCERNCPRYPWYERRQCMQDCQWSEFRPQFRTIISLALRRDGSLTWFGCIRCDFVSNFISRMPPLVNTSGWRPACPTLVIFCDGLRLVLRQKFYMNTFTIGG